MPLQVSALSQVPPLARHWAPADRISQSAVQHEVVLHYVGFAFWDVLTFPLPQWRDLGEHDEIRIDRISPVDAASLRDGAESPTLKGAEFRHFAGFLSRSLREHDYLWGRLDGAERLIDIMCDCAYQGRPPDPSEVRRIKKMAFSLILDTEEKALRDANLIATIRSAVEAL